jgi:hypothetical protein
MPLPLNVDSFRNLAESSFFTSRDIVVEGPQGNQTARLGKLVFSSGAQVNKETMLAFKEALKNEYGLFGVHAFDTVVGSRLQTQKSLRASDVIATLSRLESIKEQRFTGELQRQLATDPSVCRLSPDVRAKLDDVLAQHPFGNPPVDLTTCHSQEQLNVMVAKTIKNATRVALAQTFESHGNVDRVAIGDRKQTEAEVPDNKPTGLRGFSMKSIFKKGSTSVEDRVKSGALGAGMRISQSGKNPVLLDGLKANGVEPGFIVRKDWSIDDTRGLMADMWSPENQRDLDDAIAHSPRLQAMRDRQPPATRRELAMAAGRAHKASVAAVAEFVLQRDLARSGSEIAKAFRAKCPGIDPTSLFPANGGEPSPAQKQAIANVKRALFTAIRDTIMNEPKPSDDAGRNADYFKSPIFQHFADRHIVKLDYNESDRRVEWASGSKGSFRLPERSGIKFGPVIGSIYRGTRLTSADEASVGAVREALANDITRILGVPAQELSLVRGEYSDGHPKLMLSAKFADGYKDLDKNYITGDGQIVTPPDVERPRLGQFKAIFLALADRDAVGSHGQNKGLQTRTDANGHKTMRFFAIDPGHSLEGNGKYLEIHDDLSFKDTKVVKLEKRFRNFSVFDDDTRFSKFQGVLKLREMQTSQELRDLFESYSTAFDPNEPDISDDEKKLRNEIVKNLDEMKTEFMAQVDKIVRVFKDQLSFYDALHAQGPAFQEKAIETIANLEKLTSPTTWMSPEKKVELKHLAVESDKRVPWNANVRPDGNMVYYTKGPLNDVARAHLTSFCTHAHVQCSFDKDGGVSVTVATASADTFFDAMSEDNVAMTKHPTEYGQRAVQAAMMAPPPPPMDV